MGHRTPLGYPCCHYWESLPGSYFDHPEVKLSHNNWLSTRIIFPDTLAKV